MGRRAVADLAIAESGDPGVSLPVILRLLLSAALLVGVYSETGKWTTLALGLGFLALEATAYLVKRGPR